MTPCAKPDQGANVIHLLHGAVLNNPDRPALVMRHGGSEKTITFAELWRKADSFSLAVREKGLRPGDRAILMIPMSIELYIAMLGIMKMGGVAVFVDPWVRTRQIAAFCAFARPRAFAGIAKSHFLRFMEPALLGVPITISTGRAFLGIPARYSFPAMLEEYAGDGKIFAARDTDPALITFTSGSSGTPKGANRTHGFLTAQHRALEHEFPYSRDDVDMPMFPVFALNNLAGGRTSVIPDMDFRRVSQVDASVVAEQMTDHKVTTCTASPPFFDRLAAFFANCSNGIPQLRRVLTGGAPVSAEQLKSWKRNFPDTTWIEIVYGSTEAEPVSHISLEERLVAEGTVKKRGYCTGIPSSLVQAKVIRIVKGAVEFTGSWEELEVMTGETGELIVSGDHVCRDYFNNPAAGRENKIIDTEGRLWHRMGDTGYLDENGAFWLVGRVHSTIIRQGEFHHAQHVEQQVMNILPGMKRVAAVGIEDPGLGEKLVVVAEGATGSLTAEAAGSMLSRNGIVHDRVIVTNKPLPVDPRHNSKIDYNRLRKEIIEH